MIINQSAASICKKLYEHNLEKVLEGADPKESLSILQEALNSNSLSTTPKVITSKKTLEELHGVLSKDEYPLGMLGVKHKDLYLAKKVNNDVIEEVHTGAIKLIQETSPWMYELFCSAIKAFIPIESPYPNRKAGFSSDYAKGFTFYAYPDESSEKNIIETAVDYIHESSHQLTFLINEVDFLIEGDREQAVFSAIKNEERPAILALHGAIALAHMSLFRSFLKESLKDGNDYSNEQLVHEAEMLDATINALNEKCSFTPIGESIMKELEYINDLTKRGKNEK